MTAIAERHINFFTDFAFQRFFGTESNKELLLDFIGALPLKQGKVTNVSYLPITSTDIKDKQTVINVLCENDKGEKFLVQLQKLKQNLFKERSVYYNALPILNQTSLETNWDFDLKAVYAVALLDFTFDNDRLTNKHFQEIKLMDIDSNQVFYDKLSFIYLQVQKFHKTVEQLNDRLDKWLFVLKNYANLESVPDTLKDKVFDRFFELADIKKLDEHSLKHYEDSLKYYRDLKSTLNTAKAEGREEGKNVGIELGKQEEKIRIAKQLIKMGADIDMISEITDLKPTEIQALSQTAKAE